MRIAIVSDIHGNRTAFEAVLADLKQASPDLIFHGGDLAHGGSSPAEIVDRIRDLDWPGVLGNTDEMLFRPQSFTDFAARTPAVQAMAHIIEEGPCDKYTRRWPWCMPAPATSGGLPRPTRVTPR
jgi:3',5'-cyclic AMP phosphodiesterase CpdA